MARMIPREGRIKRGKKGGMLSLYIRVGRVVASSGPMSIV